MQATIRDVAVREDGVRRTRGMAVSQQSIIEASYNDRSIPADARTISFAFDLTMPSEFEGTSAALEIRRKVEAFRAELKRSLFIAGMDLAESIASR